MSVFGNFGIRRLVDQNQRFLNSSATPTYFRIKNFADNAAFSDMGMQFVPSATGSVVPVGTTDILIDPPPSVKLMSWHTLAMAQMAGSQLRAGARLIVISQTWVLSQKNQAWYQAQLNNLPANLDPADPGLIFKLPCVVGIVNDKLLMEPVDIQHDDAFGGVMTWLVTCNCGELSRS